MHDENNTFLIARLNVSNSIRSNVFLWCVRFARHLLFKIWYQNRPGYKRPWEPHGTKLNSRCSLCRLFGVISKHWIEFNRRQGCSSCTKGAKGLNSYPIANEYIWMIYLLGGGLENPLITNYFRPCAFINSVCHGQLTKDFEQSSQSFAYRDDHISWQP